MEHKTFNYKNYRNCSFEVGNYMNNPQAMYILILNSKGEEIKRVTVNMTDYFYSENTASIKNYSENSGMTNFLLKLDIIEFIYTKRKAHPLANDRETIDFCEISIEEIKKYSSKFNYKFDY